MKKTAIIFSGIVVLLIIFTLITVCTTAGNPPVAKFTSQMINYNVPQKYQFTDQSSNGPDTWKWSFTNTSGNNTEIVFGNSTSAMLVVGTGTWLITLNCSNSAGYDTTTRFINVSNPSRDPISLRGIQIFPPDYVWNVPVDKLPIHPNSSDFIRTQNGPNARVIAGFGFGATGNGPAGGGYALNVADRSNTLHWNVTTTLGSPDVQYSVPSTGIAIANGRENGTCDTKKYDCHAVVVDIENKTSYEFFGLDGTLYPNGSISAKSAAVWPLDDYSLSYSTHGSVVASGSSHLAGTIRYDEIEAGEIRHAIQIAIPYSRAGPGNYTWPAQTDNSIYRQNVSTDYPRMGERFRLNTSFDDSGYSRTNRIIISALKKYGMIVVDNGDLHVERTYELRGFRDSRWNWSDLSRLSAIRGSDLEAVDETSLMIRKDSGKARVSSAVTGSEIPTPTPALAMTQEKSPLSLTVVYPDGGELMSKNSTVRILWTSTGMAADDFIQVDLYKADKKLWTLWSALPNTGSSVPWTVPSGMVTGNDFRIRIASTANPHVNDTSNADFTITATPIPA